MTDKGTLKKKEASSIDEDKKIKDYVAKITKPYFDKALQEKKISKVDSMTTTQPLYNLFWRPNNYRRQLRVKTKDDSIIKNILDTTPSSNTNYNKRTKLISVHNYKNGMTIQYGKNNLTAICSQGHYHEGKKKIIRIKSDSTKNFVERVNHWRDKTKKQMDDALFSFAREFAIVLPSEIPIWRRHEDWCKGDDYIDKIPEDELFEDTYVKKVYPKGIEFKSTGKKDEEPTEHMKTYFINQAIKKVSPEIANELGGVKDALKEMLKQDKIFYSQFTGMVSGNTETMKTLVNLNKGFTDLNIRVSQLDHPQYHHKHISKDLRLLLKNIKSVEDIDNYKAKIILLSKEEKRILEDYLMNLGDLNGTTKEEI